MSDIAHTDRRSRVLVDHRSIESRALYGGFFLLFVVRAALKRLWPQRATHAAQRESVFAEARTAAGVMVASSFMGL